MPSKPGISNSLGNLPLQNLYCLYLLNLGDTISKVTLYVPVGIAVLPYTLAFYISSIDISCVSPLSVSSRTLQNLTPSIYILLIVYVLLFAILSDIICIISIIILYLLELLDL
nr:MAG TPA: hypothetical protein [Caudoviricetes sp.]